MTQILLTKNRISEAEQSQAFTRGFQPDLWCRISRRLEIKLPNHDPDNFYPLFEINKAARHVLHGTSQNSFLQPSVTLTTPPTQPASPYVKVEDLLTLLEQMAQSFLKVLTPQKLMTNYASSSTNAQAMTTLDLLSCAFCGQSGHFIAQCLICADYMTNEKCKKIWRERSYFPMDNIPHTAFLVSLSKTILTNGTSVILLNPHLLLSCIQLT
jgi:hypothetical protein